MREAVRYTGKNIKWTADDFLVSKFLHNFLFLFIFLILYIYIILGLF
jgi:hypothetical protein